MFREMGNPVPVNDPALDYIMHQKTRIWANIYSQTVHSALKNRGLINTEHNRIMLEPGYQADFEATLPAAFQFEDFLVWLFAFKEIPDDVNSWHDLWAYFKAQFLGGDEVPPEYRGRFYTRDPELPWPSDFLTQRPTNADYQRSLIPSAFAEPILQKDWSAIADELTRLAKREYDGIDDAALSEISRTVAASLAATKRIFLIGDPGTGKTVFTGLVKKSFDKILENDRLFVVSAEITDKTSETTLLGFIGIDGKWVDGILTQEREGRRLLRPVKTNAEASPERNQVNLIILNEANRQDAEAMLARVQFSLDSKSKDPLSADHIIPLGASGDFRLSPYTFVVMTGNSPRDDTGRVEQSRPFQRRISLVTLPNPLSLALETDTEQGFRTRIVNLWNRCATESLLMPEQTADFRQKVEDPANAGSLAVLRTVLKLIHKHGAGLSYGLLRKLLVLVANQVALGNASFNQALDGALVGGVGATLSGAKVVDGASIRQNLIATDAGIATVFPQFCEWVGKSLSDPGGLGFVAPYF